MAFHLQIRYAVSVSYGLKGNFSAETAIQHRLSRWPQWAAERTLANASGKRLMRGLTTQSGQCAIRIADIGDAVNFQAPTQFASSFLFLSSSDGGYYYKTQEIQFRADNYHELSTGVRSKSKMNVKQIILKVNAARWHKIFSLGTIALGTLNFGISTALASPTFTMPAAPSRQTVEVTMRGEYAAIDTKPIAAIMVQLQQTSGSENDALIAQIEHKPEKYAPPVLFVLSKILFAKGNLDDAIFWFNAARLRGDFDATRCADPSARSAIPALVNTIPVALRRAQFDDMGKLKVIVGRVVQWDKSTPYDYEYRWINLHGLNALSSGLGEATANDKPLSMPQEQWPTLAEKNRMDYLASLDVAIEQVTKARAMK